jgi:CubicO group peptidase (beta-lactamase class C family)
MKRAVRILLIFSLAILVVIGLAAAAFPTTIRRVWFAAHLFSDHDHVSDFQNIGRLFPVKLIRKSDHPYIFPQGTPVSLPPHYRYKDQTKDTASFLQDVDTTGLLVVHRDRVVYENYWRGTTPTTKTVGWSLTKSFVSALVGIAITEGKIGSVEDPVTQYVPELKGSAYEGVRLKDILQMSSGASWNEDYSDWNSDINRFARAFAFGSSLDHFVTTLKREHTPGTYHRYNSMDTQVLGLVLRRTTGLSNADYLESRLWQPLGMQDDAFWVTDNDNEEFAAAGLNATLRDFAKLGVLYLNLGERNDRQIVPSAWVVASVTPDAPHLKPGKRSTSDHIMGYGMQWWVPDNDGDYSAIGIFNQFVYVNPQLRLVIAKTSANHLDGTGGSDVHDREDENIAFFKALEEEVHTTDLN